MLPARAPACLHRRTGKAEAYLEQLTVTKPPGLDTPSDGLTESRAGIGSKLQGLLQVRALCAGAVCPSRLGSVGRAHTTCEIHIANPYISQVSKHIQLCLVLLECC